MTYGEFHENPTSIQIVTPAWEYQTNADGTGLFFDILRSVYEPVGISLEYQIVPWKRAISILNYKKADAMVCAIQLTVDKANLITPQYPIAKDYTVAVFKKDKIEKWKGTETLIGKNLIWMMGYDLHKKQMLKGLKFGWEEVLSHSSAWKRLDAEWNADIYIDSYFDVGAYIKKHNLDMTHYRIEVIWGENAYLAFAKTDKSKKLIKIYDRRIKQLYNSGELEKFITSGTYCHFLLRSGKNSTIVGRVMKVTLLSEMF